MILETIQPNELGKMMREHISCIRRMEAVRLDLDWTAEFSPEQILSCCDKLPLYLKDVEDIPALSLIHI